MKKIMLLGLVLILVLTGCGRDVAEETTMEEDLQSAGEQLSSFFENMEKQSEKRDQEEKDNAQINKAMVEHHTDKEIEYTLKGYRYQDEFVLKTPGYADTEYTTSGKFLILEFNAKNIGKKQANARNKSWYALDEEEREYTPIAGFEENHDSGDIGPGFDINFYTVYEVPSSFELAALKLYDYEWGKGYIKVDNSQLDLIEITFE